jgi:hypothetical protein
MDDRSFSMDELNDIACSGKAMDYNDVIVLLHASDFTELYEQGECLRKVIDILDDKQRTPDEEFFLGYAWYHLPEDKVDSALRNEAVEVHLNKSLASGIDFKNYLYAKELLGCQYYDTGKYEESLTIFSSFEDDCFLKAFHQRWRDVKIAELKLSCVLRLGRVNEIRGSVEILYKVIMQHGVMLEGEHDDLSVHIADPTELIETLEDVFVNKKSDCNKRT